MKAIFHAVVVLLTTFVVTGYAAEPNYVKTTVVGIGTGTDNAGNLVSTDAVSITYTDGLGRTLQSKANSTMLKTSDNGIVPAGSKFLTTCNFYDAAGRPEITTKPFLTDVLSYTSGDFESINNRLQQQYIDYNDNGDNEYAYSQIKYFDDPLSQVSRSSVPGINNRLGSDGETSQWNLGVGLDNITIKITTPHYQSDVIFKDGFITSSLLIREIFDGLYEYLLSHTDKFPSYTHSLSISRDAGGKYTQVLKAIDGSSVKTAVQNTKTVTGGVIEKYLVISESRYDMLGNLLTEIPPTDMGNATATLINDTKYQYNTLGQVIRKETPDGLIEKYLYDNAGLLLRKNFYTRELDELGGLEYRYDDFGRLLNIKRIENTSYYVEYFYDDITTLAARSNLSLLPPTTILSSLTNLKGRMVAAVAYDYFNSIMHTVDLYSYDDDGNVNVKYKIIPGVPMQKTEYSYDIHGKKLTEKTSTGNISYQKGYSYDFLGRLKEIYPANEPTRKLAHYVYNDLGQLDSKLRDGTIESKYEYSIKDQTKKISNNVSGQSRFEETIEFQPDGNIKGTTMNYNGFSSPEKAFAHSYEYDKLNRLIGVTTKRNDGSENPTPLADYVCNYSYDDIGRFKSKTEGQSNKTGYAYYLGTNRLKSTQSAASVDYIYDKYGNMVVDKTKKMVIEYDWRNLPVRFNFYKALPPNIKADDRGDCTIELSSGVFYNGAIAEYMKDLNDSGNEYSLLSKVTMLYDASGNRVLKTSSAE